MAGVTNNKTDIVLIGKLQCLGHMGRRGDIHRISDEITKSAWLRNRVVWVACAICEPWSHQRRRGLIAGVVNIL